LEGEGKKTCAFNKISKKKSTTKQPTSSITTKTLFNIDRRGWLLVVIRGREGGEGG